MNIILFGPPGVGKSTLIGNLKTKGFSAIDLEDLYPNRLRFQLPSIVTNTFLGGADISPKRKYNNAIKVLLTTDEETYAKRRNHRDSMSPAKASQAIQTMADWKSGGGFDVLLESTSLEETTSKLIQLWEKYNGKR